MILMIEQDIRIHNWRRWVWIPSVFSGTWRDRRTWRIVWGMWSLSYYPESGLREFFAHVKNGNTEWRDGV
jgi:hypothetical protein